jgi:Fanconi anemia group M protein
MFDKVVREVDSNDMPRRVKWLNSDYRNVCFSATDISAERQMQTPSNPVLYKGKDAEDFDLSAGHSWIYPTNYPVRQYQYDIVKCCLFKNTLVSLPTG